MDDREAPFIRRSSTSVTEGVGRGGDHGVPNGSDENASLSTAAAVSDGGASARYDGYHRPNHGFES